MKTKQKKLYLTLPIFLKNGPHLTQSFEIAKNRAFKGF